MNHVKGINEMFDREKFKDIIAEKDRMSWADREDDYRMAKLWSNDVSVK